MFTFILSLFLFPLMAHANAGWPALWIVASAIKAFQSFWILILFSLIIEWCLLKKYSELNWKKSGLIVFLANAVSAALGVGLAFLFGVSDGWLSGTVGLSGIQVFFIDLILIFIVTMMVEVGVVRFFWKAALSKIVLVLMISNLTTHILGVIYFFIETHK